MNVLEQLSELSQSLVGPPGPPGRSKLGRPGAPGPQGAAGGSLQYQSLASLTCQIVSLTFYLSSQQQEKYSNTVGGVLIKPDKVKHQAM